MRKLNPPEQMEKGAFEAVILGTGSGASAGGGAAGLSECSETCGICVSCLCPSSTLPATIHLPRCRKGANTQNAVVSRTPNSRQGQL